MNLCFDKLYRQQSSDGLLELCFFNTVTTGCLSFNGVFHLALQGCTPRGNTHPLFNQGAGRTICAIKENEDLEPLIQLSDGSIVKVFFFPDDSFQNGVSQVLALYTPASPHYVETVLEFEEGSPVDIGAV